MKLINKAVIIVITYLILVIAITLAFDVLLVKAEPCFEQTIPETSLFHQVKCEEIK